MHEEQAHEDDGGHEKVCHCQCHALRVSTRKVGRAPAATAREDGSDVRVHGRSGVEAAPDESDVVRVDGDRVEGLFDRAWK